LIEVRAARPDEYEAIAALCDRAFGPEQTTRAFQWTFPAGPGWTLEHNMVRRVI
jgi:hypothetical protein